VLLYRFGDLSTCRQVGRSTGRRGVRSWDRRGDWSSCRHAAISTW